MRCCDQAARSGIIIAMGYVDMPHGGDRDIGFGTPPGAFEKFGWGQSPDTEAPLDFDNILLPT